MIINRIFENQNLLSL